MACVPRVVVHDDSAIGHGGSLVAVVPPAGHLGGRRGRRREVRAAGVRHGCAAAGYASGRAVGHRFINHERGMARQRRAATWHAELPGCPQQDPPSLRLHPYRARSDASRPPSPCPQLQPHLGIRVRVVPQPPVGLPEVIEHVVGAVAVGRRGAGGAGRSVAGGVVERQQRGTQEPRRSVGFGTVKSQA